MRSAGETERWRRSWRRRWSYLSHVVHLHLSLGVPGGDLLPGVSPPHTVECRPALHVHAGGRDLKERKMGFSAPKFSLDVCTTCTCVRVYFCIIVEVPQVQTSSQVHTSKQSRVCWRPHGIIHIITTVLERVQRTGALQK